MKLLKFGWRLLTVFIILIWALPAIGQSVDFTLRYNSLTAEYEVYGTSDFTDSNYFVGGGIQLSVVLPAEIADVGLTVTTETGGIWFDNSQIFAPAADTNHDFHGIASNGSAMSWIAGEEALLFKFTIPGGMCIPGIRLFENAIDPQFDAPGMFGGDFNNYFASAFDFTNIYNANYDNGGTFCNPPFVIPNPLTVLQDNPGTVCFPVVEIDEDVVNVSICTGSPKNGMATATVMGTALCVDYTPDAGYNGQDSVCIIICDVTGLCDTSSVPVTIIPPLPPSVFPEPPTLIETPITVMQDSTITVCTPILDSNVGSTFTANLCTDSPDNGMASLTINGQMLCIEYTPDSGYSGADEVCIIVCDDSGLCDTAYIPITIIPTIQPPSIPQPPVVVFPPIVGPEDSIITACGPINDPNFGDTFTATICGQPANGTATVDANNMTDQLCITIDPDDNFIGDDTVCVIVCDQTGLCDTLLIPIVITPNQPFAPPVVIVNPMTILEDGVGTVCVYIRDPNDGDTFNVVTCGANHGTETLVLTNDEGCISYIPDVGYTGTDSICIIACDQTGKCDSTFVPINIIAPIPTSTIARPPIAIPSPITTLVDKTVNICTPILDPNAGATFTATLCAGSPASGAAILSVNGEELCLSYTPAANFAGTDPLCVIVCDEGGLCDTITYLVEVIPTPIRPDSAQAPIIISSPILTVADSTVSICGPLNDPQPYDTHTATICQQPAHGTATITVNDTDNSFCITLDPDPGYVGIDSICINICDQSGRCDLLNIPVTILPSYTTFNLKVLLQGALLGVSDGLMRDDLRAGNLIPTNQPYNNSIHSRFTHQGETGGTETTNAGILSTNIGTSDAIVDWVFVELRAATNLTSVIRTFSALVQRDGDIVDGLTGMPVRLAYISGAFYVAVKHRNHLGTMTANPIAVTQQMVTVDFTTTAASDLYNQAGYDGVEMATVSGRSVLWAGNSNADGKVKYDGIATDRIILTNELLSHPLNTSQTLNYDNAINYYQGDINLDGKVKYDGINNDRVLIQNILLTYPLNVSMLNNYHIFLEQIPE